MKDIKKLLKRFDFELKPFQAWLQVNISSDFICIELWDSLDEKYIDVVDSVFCEDYEIKTLEYEIIQLVEKYIKSH
jgi:hypothetical protein